MVDDDPGRFDWRREMVKAFARLRKDYNVSRNTASQGSQK